MAGSAQPARGAPIVGAGSNPAPDSPRQIQQTREESSSQPLTHHQLLALVTPFSRDGRHLDMAATDRAARRLVFKPLSHSLPASPLHEALSFQEVLTLSQIQAGIWRLSRDLNWPVATQQVLQAQLIIEGRDPSSLWAAVQHVEPAQQLHAGPGYWLAASYWFKKNGSLRLSEAQGWVRGLELRLRVSSVKGISAELELRGDAGQPLQLPDDLLAVLGPAWSRLDQTSSSWKGRLRLKGEGTQRSDDALAKLKTGLQHLAQTLAEPPAQFHLRFRAARWRVAGRRITPLVAAVLALLGVFLIAKLDLGEGSIWRLVMFHSPPILLMTFFCMNELPRFEIPPLPRPPKNPAWHPTHTRNPGATPHRGQAVQETMLRR